MYVYVYYSVGNVKVNGLAYLPSLPMIHRFSETSGEIWLAKVTEIWH